MKDISGLILLDKPKGITSFEAITKLKNLLNIQKVGHCGTLDPNATGLLLVVLGHATKVQYDLQKTNKVYLCSFILGLTSDTNDLSGIVTFKQSIKYINIEKLMNIFTKFEGDTLQLPPMYSAVKYHGKKLCDLARRNITVARIPRPITIKKIELITYSLNTIYIRVSCSKGTYIRGLIRDIGHLYGCGAVVKDLRREKVGIFDVKNALTFKMFDNNINNLSKKNFIAYDVLMKYVSNLKSNPVKKIKEIER
ncbi:MAG: tRNA pseudouridine(55) synthase TruB [Endomicrobium sp.]|jgi:tRNA pseudouridine55 synthase|nr:tRNA pseudouridine(55) synthase TruB [Endomicrobium sp.]